MSTLNNVASVANEKQGSFKPSIAPDGPLTDKGVRHKFPPLISNIQLTSHTAQARCQG